MIEPNSSATLVREEFKHMNFRGPPCKPRDDWEEFWPLNYPERAGYYPRSDRERLLYERVQKRANKRWEKKAKKAARAQELKKRTRIPGAWPV